MKKPDTFKILEWGIQIIVMSAVAYSGYRILEYKVNEYGEILKEQKETNKTFLLKEDFREYKRSLRSFR